MVSHMDRLLLIPILLCFAALPALAQEDPSTQDGEKPRDALTETSEANSDKVPPGLKRLHPNYSVWLDVKGKRVVMTGEIVLREGPLEMFACLKGTKEHESIVAIPTKAFVVHAALIALNATPGGAVRFRPEYRPAQGTEIEVTVYWTDVDGKRRRARAQEWIRNEKTNEPLEHPWVFGGSGFWRDEATGHENYLAEDGDFICISNFTSAMLDLPIESSQSNDALTYVADTDKIPPLKTRVTLVLTPKPGSFNPNAADALPGAEKPMAPAPGTDTNDEAGDDAGDAPDETEKPDAPAPGSDEPAPNP